LDEDDSKRKKEFRFCPVCGSPSFNWIGGLALLDPYLECRSCGHRGIFIAGDLEFAKKVREEYLAKKNRE